MTQTRSVPCNGCTLCCRRDAIILHPESGDVVSLYQTVEIAHPFTGKPVLMIPKKPGGEECIYLGDGGCTIHGHAPAICRGFDCGRMYEMYDRPTRRRMVKSGMAGADVLEQGRRVSELRKGQP